MQDVLTYEDWEVYPKSVGTYSNDDLIDAYLKGRRDQSNADKKLQEKKFEENLKKSTSIFERLYEYINNSKFNCSTIHLKIKNIYQYSAIFVVDEKDFCNDNFQKIYKRSIDIKKNENKDNTFDITIIFTPNNKHLDKKTMKADGYTLSYGVQKH